MQHILKVGYKKVKQLFQLKSKNPHPSCVIYKGTWTCKKSYIGENRHNIESWWEEHEDIQKDSEPAKHLRSYSGHSFT